MLTAFNHTAQRTATDAPRRAFSAAATDRATAKKLNDDARVGHQPLSFYKCPDAALDLDEHRNRANQQMLHKGGGGAGPSKRRRYA